MPRVKRLDEYFVVVRAQPRLKTRNSGAVTKSALPVLMLCNARGFREKRKCWKCSDVRRPFVETNAFWRKKKSQSDSVQSLFGGVLCINDKCGVKEMMSARGGV